MSRYSKLPLEKTTLNFNALSVLKVLLNVFRRPAVRMGKVDNSRIACTRIRNAQFVSFMAAQGIKQPRNTDRFDSRLRWQKFIRVCAVLGLVSLAAWVAIESARALSMF